jgi:hypothetical protein
MKNLKYNKKAEEIKERWIIASQQAGVYVYLFGVAHREKVEYKAVNNKFSDCYISINKW